MTFATIHAADGALIVLWYATMFAAPTTVAVGAGHRRMLLTVLLAGIGMALPWAMAAPVLRAVYGMASVTHVLRLPLLARALAVPASAAWLQAPSRRVAFVHFYHDLRSAVRVPRLTLAGRLATAWAAGAGATAASIVALQWVHREVPQSGARQATLLLLAGIYFVASVYTVDAFYRTLLLPTGYDVPGTNQRPWRARTVSEFWGRRWNSGIQHLLRDSVYVPLAAAGCPRGTAVLATFAASAGLHVYPMYMVGVRAGVCASVLLFFLVQALLMLAERSTRVSGLPWVTACLCTTLPLFMQPLLGAIFSAA